MARRTRLHGSEDAAKELFCSRALSGSQNSCNGTWPWGREQDMGAVLQAAGYLHAQSPRAPLACHGLGAQVGTGAVGASGSPGLRFCPSKHHLPSHLCRTFRCTSGKGIWVREAHSLYVRMYFRKPTHIGGQQRIHWSRRQLWTFWAKKRVGDQTEEAP